MDDDLKMYYRLYLKYKGDNIMNLLDRGSDYFLLQSFTVRNMMENMDFNTKFDDYENKLSLNEITNLISEILSSVNPKYKENFDEILKDGTIEFYDKDDLNSVNDHLKDGKNIGAYAGIEREYDERYDSKNAHKTIVVPLTHTIDDVYTFIHEFVHYLASKLFHLSDDYDLLTESAAITSEFLVFEYLKKYDKYHNDSVKRINFRLEDLKQKSKNVFVEITAYNKVMSSLEELKDIKVNTDDSTEAYILDKYHHGLKKDIEYFIGTVIAVINYKKYKEGILDISDFEKYNSALNDNINFDSLIYIMSNKPNLFEVKDALEYTYNSVNKLKQKLPKQR